MADLGACGQSGRARTRTQPVSPGPAPLGISALPLGGGGGTCRRGPWAVPGGMGCLMPGVWGGAAVLEAERVIRLSSPSLLGQVQLSSKTAFIDRLQGTTSLTLRGV